MGKEEAIKDLIEAAQIFAEKCQGFNRGSEESHEETGECSQCFQIKRALARIAALEKGENQSTFEKKEN